VLTITPAAAEALDAYAGSSPEPDEPTCVRIAQTVGEDGQPGLAIAIAPTPLDGDTPVEGSGTVPLFVEPEAADVLADKVLDARVEGERIAFIVDEQS
jgi:hypothetical protein